MDAQVSGPDGPSSGAFSASGSFKLENNIRQKLNLKRGSNALSCLDFPR